MNGPDFVYNGLTAFAPITNVATPDKKGLMSAADKAKLDGLGPVVLADYNAASDLANGGTLTANVWNAINVPALSFTPHHSNSLILVLLSGNIVTGNAETGVRLVLDGSTNYMVAGGNAGVGMGSTGALVLENLTTVAHTLQFQIIAASTVLVFCRPGSAPNFEFLRIRVLEFGR